MVGMTLSTDNLCKSYQDTDVLINLNMQLSSGDAVGLLGINGSGKTTMIRLLALVEKADSGNIFMDGKNAFTNIREFKSQIGFAPQDVALFTELTAMDNLRYFCAYRKKKAKNIITELVDAFDMHSFIHKRIDKLSGGMKKRVNLAVALVNNPRLLLADEPFVGLDIEQREKVFNYLKKLREDGLTQIISSHYKENLDFLVSSIYKFNKDEWEKEVI